MIAVLPPTNNSNDSHKVLTKAPIPSCLGLSEVRTHTNTKYIHPIIFFSWCVLTLDPWTLDLWTLDPRHCTFSAQRVQATHHKKLKLDTEIREEKNTTLNSFISKRVLKILLCPWKSNSNFSSLLALGTCTMCTAWGWPGRWVWYTLVLCGICVPFLSLCENTS